MGTTYTTLRATVRAYDIILVGGLALTALKDTSQNKHLALIILGSHVLDKVLTHRRAQALLNDTVCSTLHFINHGLQYCAYKTMSSPLLGGRLLQTCFSVMFSLSLWRLKLLLIIIPMLEFGCYRLEKVGTALLRRGVFTLQPLLTQLVYVLQTPPNTTALSMDDLEQYTTLTCPGMATAEHDTMSDCAVCCTPIEPSCLHRYLPCHHVYHANCVDEWLLRHNATCPLCRHDIRTPCI